jgi:Fe-S cluster biogenesis protein NfuA
MGLRNLLRREAGVNADLLSLTPAAKEAIRDRAAEGVAFFVTTQPSRLGFNVGVGYETPGEETGRRPRAEFDVPLRISDQDFERLRGYTIDFREGRFVTTTNIVVQVAETPNPESRKFMVSRPVMVEGSATFHRPSDENAPILVNYLLELDGVHSLFFIGNFCSVTRTEGASWPELEAEVGRRLQAYFAHGGSPLVQPPRDAMHLDETERKIVDVLEDVVRPAVQRDGGDIMFAGYSNGTVQLYMLGSCVGCPSSLATLKMGVEQLLKDAVPEVREVVAID